MKKFYKNTFLTELLKILEAEADMGEWYLHEDANIYIHRVGVEWEAVVDLPYVPQERFVVELHLTRIGKDGREKGGVRTHIITLSSEKAWEKFWEAVADGMIPWNDVLTAEDCLEFDDRLDM